MDQLPHILLASSAVEEMTAVQVGLLSMEMTQKRPKNILSEKMYSGVSLPESTGKKAGGRLNTDRLFKLYTPHYAIRGLIFDDQFQQ